MKVAKCVSIESDIAEKLNKEENSSELINKLLYHYYNDSKSKEQTLAEKLAEIEKIENDVINSQELKRKQIEDEILKGQNALKAMAEEQEKRISENVELIEADQELSGQLVTYLRERKANNLEIDFKVENKEVYDKVLEIINQYRLRGYRIGIKHISDYLKANCIFI
jgi:hypothetical protein